MAIEREIKLALPGAQAQAAERYFAALTGEAGRDLPLENIYFDSPALTLTQAKIALRLRKTPSGWLQTLKAAGTAQDGLHSRHEWETAVAGAALEIDVLGQVCDDAQALAVLQRAQPELIALFRTTFVRRLWRVAVAGAAIEAAIDRGEVTAEVDGTVRRAPISEIELELIEGDEAALASFAAKLSENVPGLVPENINKAQRGYALRAGG